MNLLKSVAPDVYSSISPDLISKFDQLQLQTLSFNANTSNKQVYKNNDDDDDN